jgi:hypothetical protein
MGWKRKYTQNSCNSVYLSKGNDTGMQYMVTKPYYVKSLQLVHEEQNFRHDENNSQAIHDS